MLKKLITLATTTALLGANAAAYAIESARAAVRSVTGAPSAGEEPKVVPGDGRTIQPSIPPMPPEPEHKAVTPRAKAAPKVAAHKTSRAKKTPAKSTTAASRKKARKHPR